MPEFYNSPGNPSLPDPLAVAAGYQSWAWNPSATGAAGAAPSSGVVYLTALWISPGAVITNVVLVVQTAAAGTAPTGFFVGLAGPTGIMLGQSNNLNSSGGPTSQGPIQMALASNVTANTADSPTGLYYAVLLKNGNWGTTQPSLNLGSSGPVSVSLPLGSNPQLGGTGATTGQTALPANGNGIVGGIGTTNAKTFWAGVN